MSYRTIRQAQQVAWPKVKQSLGLHKASRAALRHGEHGSAMEVRDARKSWDRVVMDETVWAIAKADLLASPEHAAVIQAARNWAKLGPIGSDWGDSDEDIALYNAVQALATAPSEIPSDELLTPVAPMGYGSTTTNTGLPVKY